MRVKNGENVALNIEELTGNYGDSTIVWQPDVNTNALTEDTTYIVAISDVTIDGNSKDFAYEVTLFDVNQ